MAPRPPQSLEMTAWNVVSTGGLLAQMDQGTLARVADGSEIVSRSTGIAEALGGSGAITQQYVGYLITTLDEIEPKLRSLLEAPSS